MASADLVFSLGGDISLFERAMNTALTSSKTTTDKMMAFFKASSDTIDRQFGGALGRSAQGINGLGNALTGLKIAAGVFIGFEILKSLIESIESSAAEASKRLEDMKEIATKALNAGVGTDFFQSFSIGVKKLGLDAAQAEAILTQARSALDTSIGEDKAQASSTGLDRVRQNVAAGNLAPGAAAALQNADSLEAKERVILDLLDQMQQKGENLAAFDLAGKVFGPEFERALRNGQDAIGAMRDAMDGVASAETARIIPAQDIAKAEQEAATQAEQNARLQAILADYHRLIAEYNQGNLAIVQDVKEVFIQTVEEVKHLVDLLDRASKAAAGMDLSMASIAQKLGAGALHQFLQGHGLTFDAAPVPGQRTGGSEATRDYAQHGRAAALAPVDVRQDRSHSLPSLTPSGGAGRGSTARQTDEVETLIKSLDKAAAAEKGEADALGLNNQVKQRSIDLAKAGEAARERGTALTRDERTQVIAAADAYSTAKTKIDAFNLSQQQAADKARFMGDSLADAFDSVLVKGNSITDVLRNLVKSLESAALKGLLTGSGPFANMFGMAPPAGATGDASVGGLLGKLIGGLHLSGGGPVTGPGTGTSDSIPAMLSAGEFVIPADVMRRHGSLIQAVYSGRLPRYANGGPVGRLVAPPAAVGAGQGGGAVDVQVHNYGGATVDTESHWTPDRRRQLRILVDQALAENVRFGSRGVNALVRRGRTGVGD